MLPVARLKGGDSSVEIGTVHLRLLITLTWDPSQLVVSVA